MRVLRRVAMPGKCLAVAATPVDWRPATQARPCRATRSASLEKLRTPMTGLSDRELTSTQGAKFTVQPARRSDQPIAAAVSRGVEIVEPAQHGVAGERCTGGCEEPA